MAALLSLTLISPAHAEEISADALDHISGDIVVLGEIHDNPTHHLNQARAIAAIKPKAVVFEMLSSAQAAKTTLALLNDEKALDRALGWEQAGWPDFAIYYPIFKPLGDARIYGAAEPRDVVRSAMTAPLPEVFGPDAARYGLDKPYADTLQKRLEAEAQDDHCNALPEKLLPGMVAAQRYRDAAFARTVQQAYQDTGGPVVLITGSGHARNDLAVPALLRKLDPSAKVVSIGQIEAEPDAPASPDQPFDYWIVTPPTPRDDPCAAFK
ncbi:ChaN family lipoprotein [Thioclava sp.]|uniref:ChaN family lipoprotein n=1 Tax=Thioclava sp. TaxID=1933450 RepID=UPI003AA989DB